ncbi:hypothetical protein J6590_011361 [Homalodisca vitripennis]|nr:hypothetical protein J6590_011361 [Homalodisca vitripennis]
MKSRSSSYHETEYPVDVSTDQEFCGKCKDVICNEMAIGCDGFCQLWYHPECVHIDNETYAAINDIADKPMIINVVLTELENQSKNNVALCGRIDNLTSNYQKLNTESEEGPSRFAEAEEKQPENKNITYSRIIRNCVLKSKTDEDNKVNENYEIDSNFEVHDSRKRTEKAQVMQRQEKHWLLGLSLGKNWIWH